MTAATRWPLVLAGLLIVFGLPLAGTLARRTAGPRCAFDGAPIEPLYRVRIVDAEGGERTFCCLHCAGLWRGHRPRPRAMFVTDEATGAEIPATSAWFVRSRVVTMPHTQNRVHIFGSQADAQRHADAAGGLMLAEMP